MAKEIQCAFGVDIDAVAGWLGSYGGEDSPSDIQRGVFAGEIGTPRLLKLFDKYKIKASWFIPGHSIETFPEQTKMIAAAGHEIGAHGYSHENPVAMTRQQEEDVLKKSIELIEKYSGKKPRGYVAPWWEMSANTAELLLNNGFRYDHSQGYNDFVPFYARVGDSWTKIDYSKKASEWMRPMKHGKEVDLVEIGANWYVDDLPPMMFIKKAPNSHGFVNPRDIEDDVARRVRLGVSGNGLCGICLYHPPGCLRQAAGTPDAGAAHRACEFPSRDPLDDHGGNRPGFPAAAAIQGKVIRSSVG